MSGKLNVLVTGATGKQGGGADRATGIPHFDSKFEVEKEIRRSGVPFTIVAPVFFMENFLADWMAAGIARGSIAMALPSTTNRGRGYRAVHRPRHRTP